MNPCPKHKPIRLKGRAWEKLREAVLKRDGGCVICGRPGSPHHVRYRSQGGDDVSSNLVDLCLKCHYDAHNLCGWAAGMSKFQVSDYLFRLVQERKTPA